MKDNIDIIFYIGLCWIITVLIMFHNISAKDKVIKSQDKLILILKSDNDSIRDFAECVNLTNVVMRSHITGKAEKELLNDSIYMYCITKTN